MTIPTFLVMLQVLAGPSVPTWSFEEELRIGSVTEAATSLGRIVDVEVSLERGEIFLLDATTREVRVFTVTGQFARRFGGLGDGVGKFQALDQAGWLGDTLWVADPAARRINQFLSTGEPVGVVSLPPNARTLGRVSVRPAGLAADGVVLGVTSATAEDLASRVVTSLPVLRFDRSGVVRDTLVDIPVEKSLIAWRPSGGGAALLAEPTPDRAWWLVEDQGSAVAIVRAVADESDETGAIRIARSRASTVEVAEIQFARVAAPDGYFERVVQRELGRIPEDAIDVRTEVRAALQRYGHRPRFVPAVSNVARGVDGTLWIRREDQLADTVEWLILDGYSLVARTELPSSYRVARASRSTIWAVVHGDFGETAVVTLVRRR